MNIEIGPETPEIKDAIVAGFEQYTRDTIDCEQNIKDIIAFCLRDDHGNIVGAATGRIFWGAFHLKNLWVAKELRGKGYGRLLVDKVCDHARMHNALFIYLETLSFQAEQFYKNIGFYVEFVREGYDHGITMIYMRKDL